MVESQRAMTQEDLVAVTRAVCEQYPTTAAALSQVQSGVRDRRHHGGVRPGRAVVPGRQRQRRGAFAARVRRNDGEHARQRHESGRRRIAFDYSYPGERRERLG